MKLYSNIAYTSKLKSIPNVRSVKNKTIGEKKPFGRALQKPKFKIAKFYQLLNN